MDLNAQFSEIFQLAVFGEINEYEKSLFASRYHFRSRCKFCQIELRGVNEFLVNYVTLANVVSSGYTNMDWHECIYIASANCCNQQLSCNSCK